MDGYEIRLKNMNVLADKYPMAKDFCAASGIDPTYFSQLRARSKNMGPVIARRIETNLGLPQNWLDDRSNFEGGSGHTVTAVAHAIESLSPAVRSAMATLIFELVKQDMAKVETFDITVSDDEQHHPVQKSARRR